MKIITLVENTSSSKGLNSEHGLSLYIETKKHTLLFDLGASSLFVENANKLNINLSKVDLVVISHGHYDHGGGLKAFLEANSKAKIYLNKEAFSGHYSLRPNGEKAYIGLDTKLMHNDRFIFVGDHLRIDQELELFSNINSGKLISTGNQNLLMKLGSAFVQDNFIHEQNLVIKEAGKLLLLVGCAHNGIVNIVEHISEVEKKPMDYVIGGFHLYNFSANSNEDPALVSQIGERLKKIGSTYYTCHCTGIESYKKLKETMGDKIHYLSTGSTLTIFTRNDYTHSYN
ncbi:MAG: ribonuclease Z [Pelotomaculum sp. PtaB.Bin104]|nr:MAG: ribonuclease Z [Pelotomaculum sp. PtaB.Bin104]